MHFRSPIFMLTIELLSYKLELGSLYFSINSWWKAFKRSNRGLRASIGGSIVNLQRYRGKQVVKELNKSQ